MFGLLKGKKNTARDFQNGPGPGAYHYELEIGGVSYVIGKGKRCHDRKKLSVGPGSYDINPIPGRIFYTMTPRRKEIKKIENFPGPGTYTPSKLEQGTMFSISKADRNKGRNIESPGPGAYRVTTPNSSRSALYFLFRTIKSHRPPLSQIIDTPGPGTYHYDLKIGGPEPTLSSKHDFKSKSIEPVYFI